MLRSVSILVVASSAPRARGRRSRRWLSGSCVFLRADGPRSLAPGGRRRLRREMGRPRRSRERDGSRDLRCRARGEGGVRAKGDRADERAGLLVRPGVAGAARTGLLLRRAADSVWESELCSMVTPSELLAVTGDHPPDPAIASVGAGWEPVSILAIVGSAIVVTIVGLLWLMRRRARPTAAA